MAKQTGKSGANRIQNRSIFLLFVIFGFVFLLLITRLFYLQIIEGPELKRRALAQRTFSNTVPAQRGSIYDRNGNILVQSVTVWNVFISPEEMKANQVEYIATNLAEILEVSKEDIIELSKKEGSYYERIKMKIDDPKRRRVEDFIAAGYGKDSIRGIYFEAATKRDYIYDNLASTVLGFVNEENHGAYGIESYYDRILSGTPGLNVSARNPRNIVVPNATSINFDAEDGYSITLTIDETIQGILEKHLEMAVVEHGVKKRAVGIIMDVETGEILAMATKPDFDPNTPLVIADPVAQAELDKLPKNTEEYVQKQGELRINQWRNKAISDSYEPGSVYKIVTAAIALEEQKSYMEDSFYCSGMIEVADREIECHLRSGHGQENFFDIMRNSCNPGFVTLGLRNGPEQTYRYMTDFGLGQVTGIDLPGEESGILHSAKSMASQGRVPLASTSFGQSFTTTPIQLITAVSTAVNGGYLVQPYVVKQIQDSHGNVIETIQPEVKRQVISEETSEQIRELVEVVVADGSGRHAAIPGYRIGGKTGTSEKLTAIQAGETGGYVLSFVGFAPMEHPKYACLIALDEPYVANPWGSVIAAPVVGAVLQEVLPYVGVEPYYTEQELSKVAEVPELVAKKPHDAQSELTALGLKTKIMGQGDKVLRQIPLPSEKLVKGGTVTIFTDEDSINIHIILPNLEGKTIEEARKELTKANLNIKVEGVTTIGVDTIVSTQWPVAGTQVSSADVVTLVLSKGTETSTLTTITDDADDPEKGSEDNTSVGAIIPDYSSDSEEAEFNETVEPYDSVEEQ